jgi:hypothetical protein
MALRTRSRTGVVAALVLAALVGVSVAARGSGPVRLPPVAPPALMASAIRALANPGPVTGELRTHVDLGIPSLPAGAPSPQDPMARAVDAINGDHRVRVWSSDDGLRVAELLPTAEVGLFVRRDTTSVRALAWDSVSFTAYRLGPLPVHESPPAHPEALLDPGTLARLTLEMVDSTTRVLVGPPGRVAGRSVYRLVVEPRSRETLVGRIEIWLDAARRLPLGVSVFARGRSSPALSVVFASVDFAPIDPSTYDFIPPRGANVVGVPGPATALPSLTAPHTPSGGGGLPTGDAVRSFGRGWETVLAVRAPSLSSSGSGEELDLRSLLPLSGSLFSIRLVERGDHVWWLLGAVPQVRLAAVERALP